MCSSLIEPGLCAELAIPVTSTVCPTWPLKPVVFPVSSYSVPELSVKVYFPPDRERQPSKVVRMLVAGSLCADMLGAVPWGDMLEP